MYDYYNYVYYNINILQIIYIVDYIYIEVVRIIGERNRIRTLSVSKKP